MASNFGLGRELHGYSDDIQAFGQGYRREMSQMHVLGAVSPDPVLSPIVAGLESVATRRGLLLAPENVITDPARLLGPGNPTTRTLREVRALRGEARWKAGEQYVQEMYGSPGQRHFDVPTTGGRFVDAPVDLPGGGVLANEVKLYKSWRTVGGAAEQQFVPLSGRIQQQILRDVYLRRKVPGFDPRWIFLDAPPSAELGKFLTDRRIPFVIHH